MKSPEYVYSVTSIYRRLLDENRCATSSEREILRRAFSRGGFTDGYFKGRTDKGMTGIRSDADKKDSQTLGAVIPAPKKVAVSASVTMRLGEPSEMTLTDGSRSVTVYGETPALAENSPLTHDGVKARLAKMGNTNLSLSIDDIQLLLDENINLSPSSINSLRRAAASAFESADRDLPEINYTSVRKSGENGEKPMTTALFLSEAAYLSALSRQPDLMDSLDLAFLPYNADGESFKSAGGVYLPPVILDRELDSVLRGLENAKNNGVMYALVSNIGQIALAKQIGFRLIGDFRLNVTNGESAAVYRDMGVWQLILSPELTLPQARDVGGSLISYGRIPLMITERCFISENFGCDSCNKCSLTDRKGEKFPMMREVEHRNLILNSIPTYMGDRAEELRSYRLRSCHLIFTVEGAEEIRSVLLAHHRGLSLPRRVRRVGRR